MILIGCREEDIDGDFDPEEYDRRMKEIFANYDTGEIFANYDAGTATASLIRIYIQTDLKRFCCSSFSFFFTDIPNHDKIVFNCLIGKLKF